MKKVTIHSTILAIAVLSCILLLPSCRRDLLKQDPTTEVLATEFWQTESDALVALMGAYAAARPCFDRDYYFDGG
jgi:starch-binding outer membrane protein, SusD/RagB family